MKSYGSEWKAQITGARFFWNEHLPLYEVAISAADGREGYLLTSDSLELPFLISRGFNGELLSSHLRRRLSAMVPPGIEATSIHADSFQYIVPFGFIAYLVDGSAIQLDDGVLIENLRGFVDQAPPKGAQVEESIASEWSILDRKSENTAIFSETILDSGPYYNQAYNADCMISGCTAVAWATWAAWLKGNAALLPNLFSRSSCWYDDWDLYWHCQQPTRECQEVDALIWWFNQVLGTVNGGTPAQNVGRGGAVFRQYGSSGIVTRPVAATAATISDLVQRGQSVLFCGVREWQFFAHSPDKFGTRYDAPVGHCVVIHGVKDNEIYVNMGWGAYTQSLWWNINSITNRQAYGLFKN